MEQLLLAIRRHVWVDTNAFSSIYLHIGFNNNLTNEERTWFNELLVAEFYHEPLKIRQFAQILNDWTRIDNVNKVAVISGLLHNKWELKEAFNYMLARGTMPELHIPLTCLEHLHVMTALNNPIYAYYRQKYGTDVKKILRMVLTSVVERKAIENRTYKYVLYALYVFRTRGYTYPNELIPVESLDNRIRHYFSNILDTDGQPWDPYFSDKVDAQIYFFQDIRCYVQQLYLQVPESHCHLSEWACLVEALRSEKPYYKVRPYEDNDEGRGILLQQALLPSYGKPQTQLTPFQYLLGNVCLSLAPHCTKALLDFKQHLLHIPALTHVVINIGTEPMFDFRFDQLYLSRSERGSFAKED